MWGITLNGGKSLIESSVFIDLYHVNCFKIYPRCEWGCHHQLVMYVSHHEAREGRRGKGEEGRALQCKP